MLSQNFLAKERKSMKQKLKNRLCLILSALILLSTVSPCYSVIAAETEKRNVSSVIENINEMTEEYDEEYEEKLTGVDEGSVTIDNRLIVETKSRVNTYDAVDVVYGMGYAFIQFENEEDA